MHIWNRVNGRIRNEIPVVPLDNGRLRIGDDELLGMPAYMQDCAARAEMVLAEFDAAGVGCGVVVQEYLDGEQNEYLLSVARRYEGRFVVHGLPDFFAIDSAAEEGIELLEKGFAGIKIPAGHLLGKVRLNDPRLNSLYQALENKGAVLALDLSEGEEQVAEFEKVLEAHSQMKVAIGHFAMPNRGGWPGQLRLARYPNVYIEGGGLVWLYRDEGYPFVAAQEAIARARDEVGIEKLMWGSDWPRTMVDFTYRQSLMFVYESNGLNKEEKSQFLGGNAARLYGLMMSANEHQPLKLITEG